VRERLRAELAAHGPEALHRRLSAVDPATAARLMPRDRQRVTRALEVFESSGRPLSWWHARPARRVTRERWLAIEPVFPPGALRERIAARTREMLAGGLVEETRALVATGRRETLARLRAVGYDEALRALDGELSPQALARAIDARTCALAKRQRTWFRHQIRSVRLEAGGREIARIVTEALALIRGATRAR